MDDSGVKKTIIIDKIFGRCPLFLRPFVGICRHFGD